MGLTTIVEITHLQLDAWSLAWRALRRKLRPSGKLRECSHRSSRWRRLSGGPGKVLVRGQWYCPDTCLDDVLRQTIAQIRTHDQPTVPAPHRVPLGLVLLSRQQITADKLRIAIEAQRFAGRGRIGEWLQTLGFVTEQQVTAALARQWACPIRRTLPLAAGLSGAPQIPAFLLQCSAMIPVDYVASTATLHLAFSEGIDRNVLYAVEQTLGCRTEPCLVLPSLLRQSLQESFEHRGPREVIFDRIEDIGECVRIIRSYCARVSAIEVRLAVCGSCLWIRLLTAKQPLDLLLKNLADASNSAVTSFPSLGAPPKVLPRSADGF